MGGGSIKEQGTIYTSPYMEKARRRSVLWCAWPPQIFSVFTQFRPSPPQFSGVFTQFCRLRLKNLISIGDRITGLFPCMRTLLYFVFPFGILKISIYCRLILFFTFITCKFNTFTFTYIFIFLLHLKYIKVCKTKMVKIRDLIDDLCKLLKTHHT